MTHISGYNKHKIKFHLIAWQGDKRFKRIRLKKKLTTSNSSERVKITDTLETLAKQSLKAFLTKVDMNLFLER